MKVEKTEVTQIKITGGDRLDPVTVFLEDYELGQGKITIECYGKSWSSFWGSMGKNTISSFFCSCDEHYIAKNLSRISSTVEDLDGLGDFARKSILEYRKEGDLESHEARALYDLCENIDGCDDLHYIESEMHEIFGPEWWYRVPTVTNPDYEYLCRIIFCVQEALGSLGGE
jgi:hypothetical protein